VRLSLTKGMIAADFLADPPGTGLDMPSQTTVVLVEVIQKNAPPMLADFVTHSIGVHSRLLKTAGAIPLKAGHPVNLIERHEVRQQQAGGKWLMKQHTRCTPCAQSEGR
jgi:hypothetical protein